MLWRSNKRKNSADPRPEGGVSPARGNAPAQQAGGDTHATADMTADTSGQAPESAAPKPEDAALGGRPAGSEADRKALLMQNEDARRMFQGLQDLRKSVHSLKNAEESITSAQNCALPIRLSSSRPGRTHRKNAKSAERLCSARWN